MCGKNKSPHALAGQVLGSPPRVQERRLHKDQEMIEKRITPACAGKTLKDPCILSLRGSKFS